MVLWKRTILMANKDGHKSCALTQIGIDHNLILTCRWYVKFDVNVFSNMKTNVAIYITRQIHVLITHVSNNWHVKFYPFIPRHFEVFMKYPKTSVSVSFEFGVDMSWQNSM